MSSNFYGRTVNDSNIPSEDIQKYILTATNITKGMQTDTNHYVMRNRINNTSFSQKLDRISKNIIKRTNPLNSFFEDISTFDAQNPIAGSLLKELDIGKKDVTISRC